MRPLLNFAPVSSSRSSPPLEHADSRQMQATWAILPHFHIKHQHHTSEDEIQMHCNALQETMTHCYTLQHTATHCITHQYLILEDDVQRKWNTLQCPETHCNTLQCPETHCNTLHHTVTHTNMTYQKMKCKGWCNSHDMRYDVCTGKNVMSNQISYYRHSGLHTEKRGRSVPNCGNRP